MWKVLLICIVMVGAISSEPARRFRKRQSGGYVGGYGGGYGNGAYTGGSAGSYAGGSGGAYAGGSTGSYAGDYGTGGYAGTGYAPDYGLGFIDPYAFHQQLTAQILAQHAAQNNALASTYSVGAASANADASSMPDDIQIQNQVAAQQAYFDAIRHQQNYNNNRVGSYKPNRYAPNYAAASGSIGPGGYHQTAFISPENPNIPNIHNRFGDSSSPGGYKGVSVSSFSSSADVDGKRTSHRGAQTTVNDNGKVTSYTVHS